VKGFAFTLGMSTVLDLVVVFLFTHPVVALLSRSKAFMSPRISGLGRLAATAAAETDAARRATIKEA
jgi:preprotein translocase subunit SecD